MIKTTSKHQIFDIKLSVFFLFLARSKNAMKKIPVVLQSNPQLRGKYDESLSRAEDSNNKTKNYNCCKSSSYILHREWILLNT